MKKTLDFHQDVDKLLERRDTRIPRRSVSFRVLKNEFEIKKKVFFLHFDECLRGQENVMLSRSKLENEEIETVAEMQNRSTSI